MDATFWICPKTSHAEDTFHIICLCVTVLCLVLNFAMLVLLLLLQGTPRIFLVQMRALTVSVIIYCVIKIFYHVTPAHLVHADAILAPLLCYIWTSRCLSLWSYTFAILILNSTVGNRAIQIWCKYQNSFASSRAADFAYLGGMGFVTMICMVPQAFIVHWDGTQCKCLDTGLPYGSLVVLYTQTFVRFGLTTVISPAILGLSCYKIVNWVRDTPPEQLSDTWNTLSLPGTTKEQMEAFSGPQGWLTATFCTVPLSVTFLMVGIFETGHEFLCAVGLCKLVFNSELSQITALLIDIQLLVLPFIFTVYIPALRDLPVRAYQVLMSSCRRLCERT